MNVCMYVCMYVYVYMTRYLYVYEQFSAQGYHPPLAHSKAYAVNPSIYTT